MASSDLVNRAVELARGGAQSPKVDPVEVACREAYEAIKADDFKKFAGAFKNAVELSRGVK